MIVDETLISLGAELNKIEMTAEQIASLLMQWGVAFDGRPDQPVGDALKGHAAKVVGQAGVEPASEESSSFSVSGSQSTD